jgi:tetratricopeptide (TPR) repeat protein
MIWRVLLFAALVSVISFGKETSIRAEIVTQSESLEQINPKLSQAMSADAYYNRGNAKSESGDKQGAISDYNQAIRINPNYADAYYNRGLAKSQSGDKQGAISDYNQAIRINPNDATTYYNRGVAKSALGDNKGAISDYNQVIRINPNDADAYNNRGNAKSALGDRQAKMKPFLTFSFYWRRFPLRWLYGKSTITTG